MESSDYSHIRSPQNSTDYLFNFIDKIKWVKHIDVYDNDKLLILVGCYNDSYIVIKFNRYSIELDYHLVNEIWSKQQVEEYIKEQMNCKKIEKCFKYRSYAIFGIYTYYKLTYIWLVKKASEVGMFLDENIWSIDEYELFAIQSKKFYKKNLGKKDVNIERKYK